MQISAFESQGPRIHARYRILQGGVIDLNRDGQADIYHPRGQVTSGDYQFEFLPRAMARSQGPEAEILTASDLGGQPEVFYRDQPDGPLGCVTLQGVVDNGVILGEFPYVAGLTWAVDTLHDEFLIYAP